VNTLTFLVDTQLPPVLASFLRRRGFDAVHTTGFANGHLLQDAEIEAIATHQGRIVVTKDHDFVDQYYRNGATPRVLYLAIGNIRNNDLINLLDLRMDLITQLFSEGATMVVIDKRQLISY